MGYSTLSHFLSLMRSNIRVDSSLYGKNSPDVIEFLLDHIFLSLLGLERAIAGHTGAAWS